MRAYLTVGNFLSPTKVASMWTYLYLGQFRIRLITSRDLRLEGPSLRILFVPLRYGVQSSRIWFITCKECGTRIH